MSMSPNKPAAWFWIISIISLLWNLMGVMAFLMQVMMTPEALQAMPENERALYTDIPMWSTIAFAVAVFGDTLGSILLLLRKKLATMVFTVSIVFTIANMFYTIVLSDLVAVKGVSSTIFPIIIIMVGFLLIWFSRVSTAKGWLS
jgi:hypothetical protein